MCASMHAIFRARAKQAMACSQAHLQVQRSTTSHLTSLHKHADTRSQTSAQLAYAHQMPRSSLVVPPGQVKGGVAEGLGAAEQLLVWGHILQTSEGTLWACLCPCWLGHRCHNRHTCRGMTRSCLASYWGCRSCLQPTPQHESKSVQA